MLPPLVPVIVGPTAVGKTAVAAAWAECEPITVVSADARQVYRGLDIGTAKPSGALLARVPHLGLDIVEPGERYSAGRFAPDARQWLGQVQCAQRRRVAQRVDEMLAAGLVDEVRGVLATGVTPHAPGLDGVGYGEAAAMLAGGLPERELRDAIVVATRRYAKRQETWFRHQLRGERGAGSGSIEVWTLDATEAPDALAARIAQQWRERGVPPPPRPAPHRWLCA